MIRFVFQKDLYDESAQNGEQKGSLERDISYLIIFSFALFLV